MPSSSSSSGADSEHDEVAGERRPREDDAKAKQRKRSSTHCALFHNTKNECLACILKGEETPIVVATRKYTSKKTGVITTTPHYHWFIGHLRDAHGITKDNATAKYNELFPDANKKNANNQEVATEVLRQKAIRAVLVYQ